MGFTCGDLNHIFFQYENQLKKEETSNRRIRKIRVIQMAVIDFLCTSISYLVFIITLPFSLFFSVKVVDHYQRAVILRLGKVLASNPKGPGLIFFLPCIDHCYIVDLRLMTFDVPPQEALTKDAVSVRVDAVVYYRIANPVYSIVNVANYGHATFLLAMTMLRNIMGQKTLNEILGHRDKLSSDLRKLLDAGSESWGIIIERVELKDVRLPEAMQRAMAAEAEATQEARAKIIDADGELKASQTLRKAADIISTTPGALQLRYLQTLSTIAVERPSTILFPIPLNLK